MPKQQMLILVDARDRRLGTATREECHAGRGRLHRAYLVMVFDRKRRLLLAQRHKSKTLWPGWWDGTVAGHVYPGETYASAARRRLREELGVTAKLRRTDIFRYFVRYGSKHAENEWCAIYVATVDPKRIKPHPKEICALQWVAPRNPGEKKLVPWLKIALRRRADKKPSAFR